MRLIVWLRRERHKGSFFRSVPCSRELPFGRAAGKPPRSGQDTATAPHLNLDGSLGRAFQTLVFTVQSPMGSRSDLKPGSEESAKLSDAGHSASSR